MIRVLKTNNSSANTQQKYCLIVADGEVLPLATIEILSKNAALTIFLDGAANVYLGHPHVWPNVVLGDLDSLWPASRKLLEAAGVQMIETPDQNYTDLEKAIQYCDNVGKADIVVANALGKRADHALGNIGFLKKYYRPDRQMVLRTATGDINYQRDTSIILHGDVGDTCAFFGCPTCTLTTRGLAYDMHDMPLAFGVSESISNSLMSAKAHVRIDGEAIVVS